MRGLLQGFFAFCLIAVAIFLLYGGAFSFTRPPALIVVGPGGRGLIVTFAHGNALALLSPRAMPVTSPDRIFLSDEAVAKIDDDVDMILADATTHFSRFHFSFACKRFDPSDSEPPYLAAGVPLWFALPPILWLAWKNTAAVMRRRYRRQHGLCPVCGYDLRGISTRCPECGTVVKTAS